LPSTVQTLSVSHQQSFHFLFFESTGENFQAVRQTRIQEEEQVLSLRSALSLFPAKPKRIGHIQDKVERLVISISLKEDPRKVRRE